MRFRLAMVSVVCALGLLPAAPAHAGGKPDPLAQVEALLGSGALFRGVVREEDMSLLFAHLRAALLAAHEGREAPVPEELNRRAEAIAGELRMRGTLTGLLLLTAFEAAARQAMRESFPAPVSPAR